MTEDELARETEKAAAANDGARLRELNKLERRNEIQSESPKYLDSDGSESPESGVEKDQLTEETIRARENGDEAHLQRLAQAEKRGRLGEVTPRYTGDADGDAADSPESSDLEARLEEAARLNERAGAEGTAEALRRLKDAEDPESALQKALRQAKSLGDDYAAGEFGDLLD